MTRGHTTSSLVARGLKHRWASSAATLVASGLIFADAGVTFVSDGPYVRQLLVGAALLVLGYLVSPWFFPPSATDAQARRLADERGVPVIYWRTGCTYCIRLRIALGRAGNRAVWMDVSRDPAASARVRNVTGGDETVPTVFAGTNSRVNPNPNWVRTQLRAA